MSVDNNIKDLKSSLGQSKCLSEVQDVSHRGSRSAAVLSDKNELDLDYVIFSEYNIIMHCNCISFLVKKSGKDKLLIFKVLNKIN